MSQSAALTYERLAAAIKGPAVAIRSHSRLQPAGGPGTKVFPPTHAGGVYATEKRRLPVFDEAGKQIDTREADCVLLDSVQSQANRIEDALQEAIDEGKLKMPLIVVEFGDQVADVQRVTSLQAPHRAADAILRDSLYEGTPFRKSAVGESITNSSLANATHLFRYCPQALFLGVWDSTGPKGGQGAKFARALVSEIVGIDAITGVRTGSRIDPLQVPKQAGPLFRRRDGSWTLNAAEAIQETDGKGKLTGKALLYKPVNKKDTFFDPLAQAGEVPDAGRPSAANHGNVTPDLARYKEAIDALGIKKNDIAAGGVSIAYAEHTAVLSLPQLRRLRFPINGTCKPEVDHAARTVLASLALVGLTLSIERGCDLRSRCLLFAEEPLSFELLEKPGAPEAFALSSDQAMALFTRAVEAARKLGLPWETDPIMLTPSPELIELVKKSQQLAAEAAGQED